MDIYLDNDPITLEAGPLGALIETAQATLPEGERMIVEVRVDGRTLNNEEIDQRLEKTVDAEELQFITARPDDLARQALDEVDDALIRAGEAQQQAADLLQQDRAHDAMTPIRDALSVWSQTQQAVLQSAQLLNVDLDNLPLEDTSPGELVNQTSEHLRAVRDQLENHDWIGLADTLAYDLGEAAPAWRKLIQVMSTRIGQNH